MTCAVRKEHTEQEIIHLLAADCDILFYLPVDDSKNWSDVVCYRSGSGITEGFLSALFLGDEASFLAGVPGAVRLNSLFGAELWNQTRKDSLLQRLLLNHAVYLSFHAENDGQPLNIGLKFAADVSDGKVIGVAVEGRKLAVSEGVSSQTQSDLYDAIADAERTIMERTAELRDRTLALSYANDEVVELLGNVVECRDTESGLHIKRVKAYTRALAEQMMEDWPEYGLTMETVDMIVSASSLHDTGKIKVPDAILLKPGRLDAEEFAIMRRHCQYGADILQAAPKGWTAQFTKLAIEIAYSHHEKWDGKGYPQGLSGDDIPLSAQIVSVADCYDALTTERVYKPAFSTDEAFRMILSGECGSFSEKILASFSKLKEKYAIIAANPDDYREKSLIKITGKNTMQGLRFLLVDDNCFNLDIAKDLLEDEGATVFTAENGFDAIESFHQNGPFDAVLMDLVMPEMDGMETTRRIRALEKGGNSHVPIIALSAEGAYTKELQEAGMDAGMAKPLVLGEFTRILISCSQKNSIQMKKQLMETLRIANTDALTKVKSVAAYIDMVSFLNSEIKYSGNTSFAIVMIDVDRLGLVNEHYGHDFGDSYLIRCCRVLCRSFPDCTVYRGGGDEFAEVLHGHHYQQREEKFQSLLNQLSVLRAIPTYEEGKASFSAGMASYDRMTDSEVYDVQKRAEMDLRTRKEEIREGL